MAIINYSDLLEDDGAFDEVLKKIDELEAKLRGLAKGNKQKVSVIDPSEGEEVKKYVQELEKLKKEFDKLAKARDTTTKTRKKASELSKKELIALEAEREALRKRRLEAKAIAKVNAATAGSVEELRARLTLVTLAWGKLTDEEKENTERGKRLVESKRAITEELKKEEKQTGDNRRNVGNYSDAILGAVRALREERGELSTNITDLKKQQKEVQRGSAEWIQYEKAIEGAEKRLKTVNEELGDTKAGGIAGGFELSDLFGGALPDLGGLGSFGGGGVTKSLGNIVGALNPIVAGIGLAVTGVALFTKHVLALEQRFTALRGEIQKTTGATGAALDSLTENTAALTAVFGDDEGETIRAQNVLMKEFGVSAEEAFKIIESGYLSGANSQGDLLDSITEYSTQIKSAGGDAKDLIKILDKSGKQGIFSDKGVDAVKEFNLRIKEQTKPTIEALESAFGKEFSNRISKGISDGSITSLQALEEISKAMNDTTIPAEKLQTVVADVFGGAGEDAGLTFLKSLQDITKETGNLVDATNPLVQQQKEQLRLEKELASVQQDLAGEFVGINSSLQNVATKANTALNSALLKGTKLFKEYGKNIGGIYASIADGDFNRLTASFKKSANSLLTTFIPVVGAMTGAIFELTEAEEKAILVAELNNEVMEIAGQLVAEESEHFNNLLVAINDNNISQEERLQLIEQINAKYPEVLRGLINENGLITDVTEARRRLGQAIVNNAFDRAKEAILQRKIDEISSSTLKRIEAERKAREEGFVTGAKEFFTLGFYQSYANEVDDLEESAKNAKDALGALASGTLDSELKEDLAELAELFKGEGAEIFGDSLDEQEANVERLQSLIASLKVQIATGIDPFANFELEGELRGLEAELEAVLKAMDATGKGYRELLGLGGDSGSLGASGRRRIVRRGGTERERNVPELDLLEQIRKKRNEVEEEGLDKALEGISIRVDKEIKGFEKLRSETKKLRDEGLIDEAEFTRRIGEINQVSKLAEEERQKDIIKIKTKFLDEETANKIAAFEKETERILGLEEFRLRNEGAAEETIERELSRKRLDRLRAEIKERDRLEFERISNIVKLEEKQAAIGLTAEEGARLEALRQVKSVKEEILGLELLLQQEISATTNAELMKIASLNEAQLRGEIEQTERLIDAQKEIIDKAGEEVEAIQLNQLRSLIQKRFDLRLRGLEAEYDLELSLLEKGSLDYQRIEEEKNNAIKRLRAENAEELKEIDKSVIEANGANWREFVSELDAVFNQILSKLDEVFSKSVEKAEERLDTQGDLVDKQRERAEKGLSNTLAFEQRELAKREAELIAANKRLERIQKIKALYASYSSNSSNPNVKNPLSKTLKDFAILEALSASFATGGYTGDGGKYDAAGTVHKGEFVIDKETTSALGLRGESMQGFKKRFADGALRGRQAQVEGLGTEGMKGKRMELAPIAKTVLDTSKLESEVRALREWQQSQPIQRVEVRKIVDNVLEFVEVVERKGSKKIFRHKVKKRF